MPELPEVEALRLYLLRERLVGQRVTDIEAHWPGIERTEDGLGGLAGLKGRMVDGISRHGKQLVLPLDTGVLGLHMGMTGSLAVRSPAQPRLKYARTVIHFGDGRRLELDDPRRWASVVVVDSAAELTGGLGPDALDPSFTADEFARRVKPKRSAIKAVLLDQHVLAGVGNIYADEALFQAGISPLRTANRISVPRLLKLYGAVISILTNAVAFIESHLSADGRPFVVDAYDERMRLQRKAGAPCPECKTALSMAQVGGRSAYFCRKCQR